MSYIGNSPGVSSQRVVTEEVISGSAKSAFYPVGGYALGYVDVLINGLEVDSSDFTATDGVVITLGTAAAVGDTVKIKAYIPRGLSDGYLKSEADAKYVAKAGSTMTGDLVLDNGSADGAQVVLKSAGNSDWNLDNYNGKLRAYNGATERLNVDTSGNLTLLAGNLVLASGKGIDFSANSNASGMTSEVLDDYEHGTWTPNIGGNATYNGQVGVYTKIGRMVTVQCDMWINVRGTGSAIQVYGMPFAAAPGNYYTANVAYFANLTGTVFWIQGIVPIHPTPQVYFETITSTSGQYTANDASAIFQNTSRIIFTATYFTE